MRVYANLDITTRRAEGRIDGRRYVLPLKTINNGSRGAAPCLYRYVGERDDGKDAERMLILMDIEGLMSSADMGLMND